MKRVDKSTLILAFSTLTTAAVVASFLLSEDRSPGPILLVLASWVCICFLANSQIRKRDRTIDQLQGQLEDVFKAVKEIENA